MTVRILPRMPTLAHHLVFRRPDNGVLARDVTEQRAIARAVLRIGRDAGLLAFHAPDGHLHVAVGPDRAGAGRFAQRLALALRAALPHGPLDAAYIRPVEDQAHLRRLIPYILGQAAHHGVGPGSALESSNLPDLLGARITGAYTRANLRTVLPRLSGDELREHLCVASIHARLVPERIAEATAAAVALPDVRGSDADARAARAAARIAAADAFTRVDLAAALGVHRSTVWRADAAAAPALVRAILLQCDLRAQLGERLDARAPFAAAPVPDTRGGAARNA